MTSPTPDSIRFNWCNSCTQFSPSRSTPEPLTDIDAAAAHPLGRVDALAA